MKKNLIKILALSAIASLSLSGCFGPSNSSSAGSESAPETSSSESQSEAPKAEVITLSEAFEYDTVEKEFVKAGQLVKLESLCVYARWGHTIIAGVPYVEGGSILSLQGIEVEMDAQPDWKGVTNGRYANVDVEGTLTNVNGRPVLKDAVTTINAEAQYDEETGDRIDDDGAYSAAYWGTSQTIRDYWDQYLGRSLSGILMEGIFQFASAPAAVTADTETDFKIVFPGENTNGEDPDNEYLINVHVPKGLNETSLAFYNNFFVGKQAGDFLDMLAMTRFDMSKKGMGYVLDDFWIRNAKDVPEEKRPTILTSWADVDEAVSPKYKTPLPNFAGCEAAGVFSYTVASYFSVSVADAELFGEETLEGLQIDTKEAAAFMIDMNCGEAKTGDVLAAARAQLADSGWELDEELSDEKAKDFYYVLKVADKVVAEINIWATSGSKAVKFIFMAFRATDEEAATLDAALDIVRGRAAAAVEGFASALPADLPADAETGVLSAVADWRDEDYLEGALIYSLEPELDPEVFTSDEVFKNYADGFEALLEASGFKAGFAVPAIGELDGYYNAASHEFVSIYLADDGEEEPSYVGIVFTYVVVTGENVCFDLDPEATWTVDSAVAYVSAVLPLIFGRAPTLYPDEDTGMVDVFVGGLAQATALVYAQKYIPQAIPSSATYLGAAQEPVEEGSELNNTYFCFSLPSANEGKIIELDIYVEWYNDTNAYIGVYVYETAAA